MKNKITIILSSLFFIQFIIMLLVFNLNKPRLLIIHSYYHDYSWVKEVNEGINQILKKENNYCIRWHYLDTKRHPWANYKIQAGKVARRLISDWKPDLIITIDDDAQEYVGKHYINDSSLKIVFCGVNNDLKKYGYNNAANVTGILERPPLDAVKEGLFTIFQTGKDSLPLRVFFIGDKSETVIGDEEWCRKFNWNPIQYSGSELVDYFDDWKKAVLKARSQADVILVSNYRRVMRYRNMPDGELVPPDEIIGWTEANSAIPVIGVNIFFSEDGGMLGIATSPNEQGEAAAKMAVDILNNKTDTAKIPVLKTSRFVVTMKESLITKHGYKIPMIYEACARTGNNFYK